MKKKILFILIFFTSLFLFACSYKEQDIKNEEPQVKKYMKTFDKDGTLLVDLSGYDINLKNVNSNPKVIILIIKNFRLWVKNLTK